MPNQKILTVVPAYGARYKSKKEVEEAYLNSKDFQIVAGADAGRYINKEDCLNFGVYQLRVRYAKKTKLHIINVNDLK